MARLESPRAKKRPRLEIIPFVDIMFFLLATFMMVSLTMIHNSGIDLNLPAASSSSASDQAPEQITISVDKVGGIFIGQRMVDISELENEFQQIRISNPETPVILQGDYECDYGRVVQVFDEARKVGLTKLILRTRKPLDDSTL